MNKQRFEVQALCEKQSLELNYSKLLEEKLELEKRFKLLDENQYKGEKLTEKNQYETEKRLENEMNQIVAEKDQFEGENIRLVAEKNQFQLENIELKRGKELLATENSELKEWINQLDEQKNQLDARINQLEAQKNQLDAELKGKQLYERLTEDTERLQLQETRGISGSRDPIEVNHAFHVTIISIAPMIYIQSSHFQHFLLLLWTTISVNLYCIVPSSFINSQRTCGSRLTVVSFNNIQVSVEFLLLGN